ncbi:MAG TPA: zinc ABC transporter substrate-binding protein [Acidimicrobiales bacterium]|nr:zinc ABC transporter substrate-binding protein [Acidimicrobiales bacterium]
METAIRGTRRLVRCGAALTALFGAPLVLTSGRPVSAGAASPVVIRAIGVENEYASVISQLGGRYVTVSSILNNPNTDPHTYEVSASVAQEVGRADLIVQNGVGYDAFINNIETAQPSRARRVIVAQHVLGLPDSTPNPHLWYSPRTMPAVASAITQTLSRLAPTQSAYFQSRLHSFDHSLGPWLRAIAAAKTRFTGTPVATTEPVADYLLTAMGLKNLTPFVFQADIMNGVDPSPQDITLENGFFTKHEVKAFCYNQQVVSPLTGSIRQAAQSAHVPIVGVYETMPTPGYDYQTWMLAEVRAITAALTLGTSTAHL